MNKELYILRKLDLVRKKGKVNIYSILYKKIKIKDNYSIALPSNINKDFLKEICDNLETKKDFECKKYNPEEVSDIAYEWLEDSSLDQKVDIFRNLNEESIDSKDAKLKDFQRSNLLICDLEYKNKQYYIFMSQESSEQILKNKKGVLFNEGKIELISNNKGFLVTFLVDCIYEFNGSKSVVYIFNRKNFYKFFDYEEHLKKKVFEKRKLLGNYLL